MARPRSDIAPRILRAARQRFLHEGVDGSSLRQIADDAGTNIGMVYYYFPTKDALFLAVVEEVYAKLLADLEVALAPAYTVEERVRALFERLGKMSDDEFDVIRLILREAMISSTRLGSLFERFTRGHIPLVFRLLGDGVLGGTFSKDLHPAAIALSLMSLAAGAQLFRRTVLPKLPEHIRPPEPEELAHQLSQLFLRGSAAK